ncbi:phosphopantetheine-binding protein [Aliiroseovarius marinus]|uniref:phosphopantetheine-binding protein n=1 Tax=Aliiroseovarius marinus TaxID=2500159 RepID=UPI00105EB0F7|nr:phosphopantetheine-binding protein [Aliiroseovarius marinus]
MTTRQRIIEALHQATGALDDPLLAPKLLGEGDVNLLEVNADSLVQFEFMMHLEEAFDIELNEDDFQNHAMLNALQAHIDSKIAA